MPKSTNPLLDRRRKASSSSSPTAKSKKSSKLEDDAPDDRLPDAGLIPSLAPRGISQDVQTLIRYIHAHAWADIPDRASGMGSERISEILRFRQRLPRVVSIAHLHALSTSSTATEREMAQLLARGAVRKLVVPGRGKGGGAVGEGVVLIEDWKTRVREEEALSDETKEKYIGLLDAYPNSSTAPTTALTSDEVRELVSAGFLTSPSALSSAPTNLSNLFASPGASTLSQSGSRAATGSLAAVGGSGAVHESGGGGSMLATKDTRPVNNPTARPMTFSLPYTGAYLKLLLAARAHLIALLTQSSPRYKEATLELLKEKWDGNIPNDARSRAKRARGEWCGVLPGKTRKWREFYGLEFEWVLEEAVGSGVVELFETGSVGLAVRVS